MTFIGGKMQWYPKNESTREVLGRIDRLVELEVTSDPESLKEAIRQVVAEEPVDATLAQDETAVEATAIACEALGLPFTSAEGVQNARDKARARELLARDGLPSARYARVHNVEAAVEAAEAIGYPVIVKPVSGLDSIMAFRADDARQARDAAQEIVEEADKLPVQIREQFTRGILVEEYVSGTLLSAEIGLLDGQAYRFMVSGRSLCAENECLEMGVEMPANLEPSQVESCFEYAEDVCKALGLDLGVFHVEMMMTDRGPILVETNPRLMGGLSTTIYQLATGEDISDNVISIYLRRPPENKRLEPQAHVTVRRLMPLEDGRLADTIDLSWMEDTGDHLARFVGYKVSSGERVKRLEVIGRILVRGETWAVANSRANQLLDRFEESLGVGLARPL